MKQLKRKPQRSTPEISTASLPDIIFMLLFFFMVVTVMRKDTPRVSTVLPATTYTSRFETPKDQIIIRIGATTDQAIQINSNLVSGSQVEDALQQMVAPLTASEKEALEIVLYADKMARMADISAVKLALRKSGLLRLRYVTNRVGE